eukprot:14621295-Alexandrium_andersonii.AAC.1
MTYLAPSSLHRRASSSRQNWSPPRDLRLPHAVPGTQVEQIRQGGPGGVAPGSSDARAECT